MNDVIKTTKLIMQNANSSLKQAIKAKDVNKVAPLEAALKSSKLLSQKHIREKA